MRAVDFVRRKARKRDEFLRNLRADMNTRMEKRDNISEKFISRGSLQIIWSEARLKEFVKLFDPGFDKTSIPDVQQRYIQTLSILVSIKWDGWPRFGTIFLMQGRADCDIPTLTLDALEDSRFLGPEWADIFFSERCVFCPIDILEGQNIVQTNEWRLPFLKCIEGSKFGGFGEVVKGAIAPGHFRPLDGRRANGEPSKTSTLVACKSFSTRRDFRNEVENLSLLRGSPSWHDRIVLSLATVTMKQQFSIIFPCADMDLDEFLAGEYEQFPVFTLSDLVNEASGLAGALAFLHGGLQPENLKCRHMDLKPPNVLIFKSKGYRAGEWKITDFGISIIDKPDQHPETVSDLVQDITFPVPGEVPYHTSTYQPPEASNDRPFGRRSDVWSLGCILMRVLAFGLGGKDGLQDLDVQRGELDGLSYRNDKFYRGSPPVLNPHVGEWLDTLIARYPEYSHEFLARCRDLLFKMLSIEKYQRPLSSEVYEDLLDILENAPPERRLRPASDTLVVTAQPQGDIGITATVESLVDAIKKGKTHDLRIFLNGTVMVEEKHDGDRPVIHAIRHKRPDAVERLREYRRELDLETPDSGGNTPLKVAVETGDVDMVETLLNAGVNMNARSKGDLTPLMAATKRGDVPIIKALLGRGADPMVFSEHGYTALHYAAMIWDVGAEAIRMLIESVETVDIPAQHGGQTPLFMLVNNYSDTALWRKKYNALRQAGADINRVDDNDMTPLAVAVQTHEADLAERLLKQNAAYGPTPLPKHPPPHMKKVIGEIAAKINSEGNGSIVRRRQSSLRSSIARG
ncbi:uncharacterized protein LDX57_000097 [Aspergillus melleus]|uniref:uncharacterized protein n=1 Tax=Aspergillus melleus TaxID=138277 RepID=UPI001E8EC6D1|nr:uncharacterized protein LDX57_000097 [Aspergillus melleus]KAH8422340.1 hypothetical protein LDX57_000097 [Aspergillus melleus]